MHNLIKIPKGHRVEDLLPIYIAGTLEINSFTVCPGCSNAFSAARKPCLAIKLYPIQCGVPVVLIHRLCGGCSQNYQNGGDKKNAVLSAVARFIENKDAPA